MNKNILIIIILITIIILTNCRDDYDPTGPDYTEYGWTFFDDSNLDEAKTWFKEAIITDSSYADGYNGLGWSLAYMDSIETAYSVFQEGINIGDTTDCFVDLLAGRIFTSHALAKYDSVVVLSDKFLEMGELWSFSYDNSLNENDVYIILSLSYFSLKEYENCLILIQKIESTFTVDINSQAGISLLSIKLEELSLLHL